MNSRYRYRYRYRHRLRNASRMLSALRLLHAGESQQVLALMAQLGCTSSAASSVRQPSGVG